MTMIICKYIIMHIFVKVNKDMQIHLICNKFVQESVIFMFDVKEMGKRIRELRGSLSQDKCADALGISRGALSFYENGDRKPDAEIIFKMADYFNVSSDYLIGLSGCKSINDDIKVANKFTGLSEKAICNLQKINEAELSYHNPKMDYYIYPDPITSKYKSEFLNYLLENESISHMLSYAFDYALDKLSFSELIDESNNDTYLSYKYEFADYRFMKQIKQYLGDQALNFAKEKNILSEYEKEEINKSVEIDK